VPPAGSQLARSDSDTRRPAGGVKSHSLTEAIDTPTGRAMLNVGHSTLYQALA
jgi:hypothetical protein